jgi:hypothetical protein
MDKSELTKNTGVFLSLIDHTSRTYLATIVFPSSDIIPGEQYNCQVTFGDDRIPSSFFFSLVLQKNLSLQRKFNQLYPSTNILEVRGWQGG